MTDDADPTVKELLEGDDPVDEATRRELERWFGMPSADHEEQPEEPRPEDPEGIAAVERRAAAVACVDPALLEAVHARHGDVSETMLYFHPDLEVHIDPSVALFDVAMLERFQGVAEPREMQRPEELDDDLRDRAPQALLRDLHRPETDYVYQLEIVDYAAQQRLDPTVEVERAMKTSWRLPPLGRLPWFESCELLAQVRRERAESWPVIVRQLKLRNRMVAE
jgi:hypothetical protein